MALALGGGGGGKDMYIHKGVSKNNGKTPQIIHFNRVFHYKPSILGGVTPIFWKDPYLAKWWLIFCQPGDLCWVYHPASWVYWRKILSGQMVLNISPTDRFP